MHKSYKGSSIQLCYLCIPLVLESSEKCAGIICGTLVAELLICLRNKTCELPFSYSFTGDNSSIRISLALLVSWSSGKLVDLYPEESS